MMTITEADPSDESWMPLVKATVRVVEAFVRAIGARAPARRRPRRVARKLEARGGYLHHDSAGAYVAKLDIQSQRNDPHETVAIGAPVTAPLESEEP